MAAEDALSRILCLRVEQREPNGSGGTEHHPLSKPTTMSPQTGGIGHYLLRLANQGHDALQDLHRRVAEVGWKGGGESVCPRACAGPTIDDHEPVKRPSAQVVAHQE